MSDSPRCRHCGKPIQRSYAQIGTGWTHVDSNANGRSYCQRTLAEPEEVSE